MTVMRGSFHIIALREKFRIVFDCAARFKGTSLNEKILQGPDNANNLVGVLARFRRYPIALVGDIRAIFYSVKVDPRDQSALRFLWWEDDGISRPTKVYQLTVHCFGLTSSPSVAGFLYFVVLPMRIVSVRPQTRCKR